MVEIIPAILTNDPEDLKEKLKKIKGVSDYIHLDIMDGHFVDGVSCEVKNIPADTAKKFRLEIHLMVQDPQNYFSECDGIGAKRVFFHAEAVQELTAILDEAEKFNFQAGVALNPETSVSKIFQCIGRIKSALVMGVHPGLQGQKFIPAVVDKIKEIKTMAPEIIVEVDGGINPEVAKECIQAGADRLVSGSYIMNAHDPRRAIQELRTL